VNVGSIEKWPPKMDSVGNSSYLVRASRHDMDRNRDGGKTWIPVPETVIKLAMKIAIFNPQ